MAQATPTIPSAADLPSAIPRRCRPRLRRQPERSHRDGRARRLPADARHAGRLQDSTTTRRTCAEEAIMTYESLRELRPDAGAPSASSLIFAARAASTPSARKNRDQFDEAARLPLRRTERHGTPTNTSRRRHRRRHHRPRVGRHPGAEHAAAALVAVAVLRLHRLGASATGSPIRRWPLVSPLHQGRARLRQRAT